MTTKKKVVKKKGRGNPAGPPVRGRRGHSSIDQQPGFKKWLEDQLLKDPRPTYDELAELLKGTGFYTSRASLARYGLKFEAMRAEMKLTSEKARLLAALDDPEAPLMIHKGMEYLAITKLLDALLQHTGALDEKTLGVIQAFARIESSSSSRERAATAAAGKFKSAMRALQRGFEEKLRSDPKTLKTVVDIIEKTSKELSQ